MTLKNMFWNILETILPPDTGSSLNCRTRYCCPTRIGNVTNYILRLWVMVAELRSPIFDASYYNPLYRWQLCQWALSFSVFRPCFAHSDSLKYMTNENSVLHVGVYKAQNSCLRPHSAVNSVITPKQVKYHVCPFRHRSLNTL